jgi:hypothetical protein
MQFLITVHCHTGTSSPARQPEVALPAGFNAQYISFLPFANPTFIQLYMRVKSTQLFPRLSHSGGAGKDMSGIVKCPLGFTSGTGIEQRRRKFTVLKKELADRIGGLVKFEYNRMLNDKVI